MFFRKIFLLIGIAFICSGFVFGSGEQYKESELYQGRIIDAHAHFNPRAVDIDELVTYLDEAKINKVVLFSSAEYLEEACAKYPDRIIPFLRPFDMMRMIRDGDTTLSEDMPEEANGHLEGGFFKGMGEMLLQIHPIRPFAPEGINNPADSPVMLEMYDLAARYGVPINVHVDSEHSDELERALKHNRNAIIVWAHCGYADPFHIRSMMDRHPNLYGDLSILFDPYKQHGLDPTNGDGTIEEEWKDLLETYSDRLMFGTDMGKDKERYRMTAKITRYYRGLLYQLSDKAAEDIAYKTILKILKQRP